MPFPITCAACHKTFSIADDVFERKVKGRVVTIKCKQCQSGIRVDGTKQTPVFSVADSVRPPPFAPADAPAPAVEPVIARAPALATPAAVASPVTAKPALAHAPGETKSPAGQQLTAKAPQAPKAAPTLKATPLANSSKAGSAPAPVTAAGVSAAKTAPTAKLGALATTPKAQAAGSAAQAVPKAFVAHAASGAEEHALTPKAPPVAGTWKAPPPAPEEPAPQAKKEPPSTPQASALPAPAVNSRLADPARPAENLWAVDNPDGEDRELTLSEIEKELAAGRINLGTLVWREGMAEWLELGQLPELRALPAAPPPPYALPNLPARRLEAPAAPAFETGSSWTLPQPAAPMPAQQRPPAPSAPVIDFAEREGLKAPPAAPFPKLLPTFATNRDSRPPTPPAYTPGVSALPDTLGTTAPAAFPALAAPAPARPRPVGAAPLANVEDWPQRSGARWIIAGIALLAVGGLIFFFTRSSGDPLPPPVAISALPAITPSTPPHSAEPEPATTPDSTAVVEPSPGSNAAIQPPGSAPLAPPNAGFAELFASGARGADEKHGVMGPAQRFDLGTARAALAAAANATAACREKGGPTGKATVVVTFEPSGKVASAAVSDAPFAGTSSGDCIAATMKRATVPPFSGSPGTLTKIISIQ